MASKHLTFLSVAAILAAMLPPLIDEGRVVEAAAPSGYGLVWSDEFSGSSLDTSKWGYQRGTWSGSGVQNCYVDDNTSVSGGTLKIVSRYEPGYTCFSSTRDFTSGFIQTKNLHSWTYGYFEARVKVPNSDSTWPAFWMSPQTSSYGSWPQSGEIDVFEIKGHDLSRSYGNAHWGNSSSDRQQEKGTYSVGDAQNWHTYAVEWTEGRLDFYIDGNYYHTINNFDEPNATTHPGPFNIPFYLRLNMAVGGSYLDSPHDDANNNTGQLPATMEVDWVRVHQKTANVAPSVLGGQSLNVAKTAGAGSTIGTVSATDSNGDSLSGWRIDSGNSSNTFSINSSTGSISINNPLTDSSPTTYYLGVSVSDGAARSSIQTLTIEVSESSGGQAPAPASGSTDPGSPEATTQNPEDPTGTEQARQDVQSGNEPATAQSGQADPSGPESSLGSQPLMEPTRYRVAIAVIAVGFFFPAASGAIWYARRELF